MQIKSVIDLLMRFAFSELLGSLYNAALSVYWLAAAGCLANNSKFTSGRCLVRWAVTLVVFPRYATCALQSLQIAFDMSSSAFPLEARNPKCVHTFDLKCDGGGRNSGHFCTLSAIFRFLFLLFPANGYDVTLLDSRRKTFRSLLERSGNFFPTRLINIH